MSRQIYTKEFGSKFSVTIIPTLKDNFTYLLRDYTSGELAVVDMNGQIDAVLQYVQNSKAHAAQAPPLQLQRLQTILSTHKHWDHAGGNLQLREKLTSDKADPHSFRIIGGANDAIPGVTQPVREGDTVYVGNLRVRVLDIPCHTSGHVAYVVQHKDFDALAAHHTQAHPPSEKHAGGEEEDGIAVFTGDTLFLGGLGAFFEGDAAQMCTAMKKLFYVNQNAKQQSDAASPHMRYYDARTYMFPGHEYTAGFMTFTEKQLKDEERYHQKDNPSFVDTVREELRFVQAQKKQYAAKVKEGLPSPPSTLADEKIQNLFLRTADPSYVQRMKHKGATEVALMDYLYNACD